ncbi:lipopolysaccharide-assembly, LptC-related family protein [Collimonas fungivorans]|uniref:Lipopolysaccharide-assembly, LptC-related family protein n=1 Tax=Collimonas fungivorans TaxID=158899 RepID=A0A127P6K7_9BURK|nr:LPS export ABC transporter periplasmic protein LptC [Collimonas fungivorans]AMO93407.1 lipopolysaccharide-assembly, LptC-related family protein [Collimonas fungivorans]
MKNLRSTYRFRFLLLLILFILLALGSFWLMQVMHKNTEDLLPKVTRTAPDYFVEHFNYVQMSPTGQPRYNIAGDLLTHNPGDDSFDVQKPLIHSLDKEKPPMNLRADRGKIEDNNSKVHLYGNVNADRPKTPQADNFHLKSEYLLLLPDDDVMQSDKPVEMILGQSTLHGTGMDFNNSTRVLKMFSKVHGVFPPKPR